MVFFSTYNCPLCTFKGNPDDIRAVCEFLTRFAQGISVDSEACRIFPRTVWRRRPSQPKMAIVTVEMNLLGTSVTSTLTG
jgi:hypothetical protein